MFERIVGLAVIDDQAYEKYREGMLPILSAYGGAFGYDLRIAEVLMSPTDAPINRVFTIEFASREKMEAFFSDPEYLAVKKRFFDKAVAHRTVISLHEKLEG